MYIKKINIKEVNTMKDRLNAIDTNLTSAVNAIADLRTDLVRALDVHKSDLLTVLNAVKDTRAHLNALGDLCEKAGIILLDVHDDCDDIYDLIGETLLDFDAIPAGSYSTFAGFCDQCGKELHLNDDYDVLDDGSVVCIDCINTPEEVTTND
jgi:hypothetical protein